MDKGKQILINLFTKQLDSFRIKYSSFNDGIHIQVQLIHNFYPTSGTYYNSDTGQKCEFPDFNDSNEFLMFLQNEGVVNKLKMTFMSEAIINILQDCKDLDEAIKYFTNLNE